METTAYYFTEAIGYLASAVVLISFLMKDIAILRTVNCVGCGLFVFYGILTGFQWPIIITNVAIVGINIYFLVKSRKNQKTR